MRGPSSGSVADPVKRMLSVLTKVSPVIGLVMDAVGSALTVMPIEALPEAPSLSVAVRVMVWLPALREALMDSPVPIGPSRLEVHTREAPARGPSSGSVADPLKAILSVVRRMEPPGGLMMDAVGGELG